MTRRPYPVPRILAGIASVMLFVFAAWACVRLTDNVMWHNRSRGPLPLVVTRGLLLLLAAGASLATFVVFLGWTRARWLRRTGAALLAATWTVLLLEGAFTFVARSHNVGYTLASRLWFKRHWQPINSLGYRDAEPVRVDGKRLVLAVGDSFTAGHGLRSRSERFPDQLAASRDDLQVMNVGRNGADSHREYEDLVRFPLHPDVIVLQYYPNDIEGAAQRLGMRMPGFSPLDDIASPKLRFLVRGSYLANFLYWQFPHVDGVAYARFLEQAMGDPKVLRAHHDDLRCFVDRAHLENAQLIVVVFPLLHDVAWSQRVTHGVAELFTAAGAAVIDVADLVADIPVGERTVNHHDAHASAAVHRRVAAAVAAAIPRR